MIVLIFCFGYIVLIGEIVLVGDLIRYVGIWKVGFVVDIWGDLSEGDFIDGDFNNDFFV